MLTTLDAKLRDMVGHILNVDLSDEQWDQAALPVRWGGIGIRKPTRVALSAYMASAARVAELVTAILPLRSFRRPDALIDRALQMWKAFGGSTPPAGPEAPIQKCWDLQVIKRASDSLLHTATDNYTTARIQAVLAPHAGDWLNAPPISSVGLRLTNEALRVAVGLRLGANICTPHIYRCSAQVDGEHRGS